MSTPFELRPTYRINVNLLEPAPWNVTEEDPKVLATLIENMRQVGVTENIVVVPILEQATDQQGTSATTTTTTTATEYVFPSSQETVETGRFRIINGHDRCEAAKRAGITHLNAVICPEWDEDMQKFQTVRHNVMRKKLSLPKFMSLYNQMSQKYSEAVAQKMMMFADSGQLDEMLKRVRAAIPEGMRPILDQKKKEIKTMDDLTTVVGEIFNRCGSTLDRGYVVFSYFGQSHVYVAMSDKLQEEVQKIVDRSEMQQRHISDIFVEAILGEAAIPLKID